jgi:probable phosphoglycerate mutase
MTGTIYLLRHGETVWNRAGRLQGQIDVPLTRLGMAQADAMGRTLKTILGTTPDHFIASPLGRTRQTASIVAEHLSIAFDDIEMDPRLMEITLGDFDGAPGWDWIDAKLSDQDRARYHADRWNFRYPNGECSQDVQDRVLPVLQEVFARGGTSIIVAHGVVNKILRGLHLNLSRKDVFALDRPQDAFFRLHPGGEDRIEVDAAPSPNAEHAL